MSQPTQLAPDTSGDTVYRPLSLLAVGSLALAALYAALVLSGALLAFVQGAPYFWPDAMLLMPLAAAALSVFARWRIARSEDTLAGANLARWAWWLSIVAGLGYYAYFTATGMAVKQQASRFLMEKDADSGFLARLLEGDASGAFLLTIPSSQRGDTEASDPEAMEARFDLAKMGASPKGPLSKFRESELVQSLLLGGREMGKDCIQELGVKDWSWEGGGYKVERTYRVTTSEATFDVLITVRTESEAAAGGRKWYVDWGKGSFPISAPAFTARGHGLRGLRAQAMAALARWSQGLSEGRKPQALPKDETAWDAVRAVVDEAGTMVEARQLARRELDGLLRGQARYHPGLQIHEQQLSEWEMVDGRVRLTIPFSLPVQPSADLRSARYMAEGVLKVESRQVVDVENPRADVLWDIVSYRVNRVVPAPRKGPG